MFEVEVWVSNADFQGRLSLGSVANVSLVWHKARSMENLATIEFTGNALLIWLANHYTMQGVHFHLLSIAKARSMEHTVVIKLTTNSRLTNFVNPYTMRLFKSFVWWHTNPNLVNINRRFTEAQWLASESCI